MSDNESQVTAYSDDEGRSEDQTITLIRLVEERNYLYRKTDKRYSDRNLTERTWTQISTELGWTKEEAKERWAKLRNNFTKVLARRKAKTPSGSAASAPIRRWTYEAEMEFLKGHMLHSRAMSSSIRASSSSAAPSTSAVHEDLPVIVLERDEHPELATPDSVPAPMPALEPTPLPAPAPTPRAKKIPAPDAAGQAMIAYMRSMTNQTEENQLVMWFKSLMPRLKSFTPDQLMSFQFHTMQEIQRISSIPQRGADYQIYPNYGGSPPNQHQQYNVDPYTIQSPLPASYEQERRNHTP